MPHETFHRLSVSIVIATRNRPLALAMGLPLLLAQTRLPDEIVVVDSSDDHAAVAELIGKLSRDAPVPIKLIRSAPGSSLQRNVGVGAVSSDIVIFPDDDSLFLPEAVSDIIAIYELDRGGVVAGVSPMAATRSPLQLGSSAVPEMYVAKAHRGLSGVLADLFVYVENRVILRPYAILANELVRGKALPPELALAGCFLIADQEGFRMSFRRNVIMAHPFNERLRNYALGEDKDASFGALANHILVGFPKPLIYHHEFPGVRHDGFRRGVMEILNQAYITCRHCPPGNRARRAIRPHARLLLLQMILRSHSPYQRERLRGARAALEETEALIRARPDQVDAVYSSITARLFPEEE